MRSSGGIVLWRKKKKSDVLGDRYESYDYPCGDGKLAQVWFDCDLLDPSGRPDGFDRCLTVFTHLLAGTCAPDGQPTADTRARLDAGAAELLDSLSEEGVPCRLVGVLTKGGYRDLVFQCADADSFVRHAEAWAQGQEMPAEVREIQRGWVFFDEKIAPAPMTWQRILDRRVVRQLVDAGSDPTVEHVIEHFFKGPEPVLAGIRAKLADGGFGWGEIRDGSMMMTWHSTLDPEAISEITGELRIWCARLGAEYDGWGARVVR